MAIQPEKYIAKDGTVSWRYRARLGVDASGKPLRQWVTRPTERECRAAVIALMEKGVLGTYRRPDGVTVAAFCDRYAAYQQDRQAPATAIALQSAIRTNITPFLGALKLHDVGPLQIAAWMDWLQGLGTLEASSINAQRAKLHRIFAQAVEWELIERNPVTRVAPLDASPAEPVYLDEETVAAFLRACRGHLYESYFLLGFGTGLRRGELLGATWADLHLDAGAHGEIHVTEQLRRTGRGSFGVGALKTPTSARIVPLPPGLGEQLRRFKVKDKEQRLKRPGWNADGFIVVNTKGKHTWPWAIDLALPKLCQQAGVDLFTSHAMRHTYASLLAAAGVPWGEIQELLGHRSLAMTGRYTHVYRKRLAQTVRPLGALFGRADGPPVGHPEIFRPTGGPLDETFADNGAAAEG